MSIKKIKRKIAGKIWGEEITIGNYKMKLGRRHNLPYVLESYPEYGANLVRLAKCVKKKYTPLTIFDIGANVGDTAAMLLNENPDYTIVCIEGDSYYFKLLSDNFGKHSRVNRHQHFLGSKDGHLNAWLHREEGTLTIDDAAPTGANALKLMTLDSLISEYPHYAGAKLIKIDTDGYDNQILYGAKKYLSETKPILYFEYDTTLLAKNKENGLDIFDFLKKYGYADLAFFDNYGRFLLSIRIDDAILLQQLDRYIGNGRGAFAYYDIVAFHANDSDISKPFILGEEKRG